MQISQGSEGGSFEADVQSDEDANFAEVMADISQVAAKERKVWSETILLAYLSSVLLHAFQTSPKASYRRSEVCAVDCSFEGH